MSLAPLRIKVAAVAIDLGDGLKIRCPKGRAGSNPAPGTPSNAEGVAVDRRCRTAGPAVFFGDGYRFLPDTGYPIPMPDAPSDCQMSAVNC